MNGTARISCALAAVVVLLSSATASGQIQSSGQREAFTIEIDVFSGRPNPRLLLTEPAEVSAFIHKVQEACTRATPTAQASEYPDILGYRGLSVSRAVNGGGPIRSFLISRQSVRMTKQNAPLVCIARVEKVPPDVEGNVHLRNAGTALEAYVAQVALQKGVITQPVYEAILKQLVGD